MGFSRWAGMLRSYLDPRQVGYLIFYVTNRCNFRCDFCFYSAEIDKGRKPEELTLDEIRRMAEKLGPLLQLSLTGGEPFLRPELADIARVLLDHTRAPYVTIPTNGSLPDRAVRFLEELLPAYPGSHFRLCLSIEGIGEEHDALRSAPGSFAKIQETCRAVAPLRRRFPNLVLDSNSVLTARSEGRLLETLKTLDREFDFDNMSVTLARGEAPDPGLRRVSRERYVEINGFLESLRRRQEGRLLYPLWRAVRDVSRRSLIRTAFDGEFVSPCVGGRKLVVVSESGEVTPCEILGRKLGDLRDFDFDLRALLSSRASQETLRWIRESRCKCSFECALAANAVWNPADYPALLVSAFKNLGRR